MDDLSEKLKKLGAAASETAERLIDPSELDAARRRWLHSPAPSPSGVRRPVLLVAAACLVALLFAFVIRRPDGRVSFVVGAPPTQGSVGEWVAADRDVAVPLRFSEGTSFTLARGAAARVTSTTAHGATLLLERGQVTAAVVHVGEETRWSVHAGPFWVSVTGTRFDASWDPTGETFTLAMQEGTVFVKGPLLDAGRGLCPGERLRVSVRDGSMEVRSTSAAPGPNPPAPSAVATIDPGSRTAAPACPQSVTTGEPLKPPAKEAPTSATSSSSAAASPAASPHEPSWRELAAAGKFDEALAAAERTGFAREIERVPSPDLAMLADAARYAGRPALARDALLAQRRRFGARGSTAFMLGKIAADQQGGADAVRWFETYLSEVPNGALVEQALGRILELKKGNPAEARAIAERYLTRHPHGAHAALARSLVSP
jgi:hypothetical protein